MGDKPQSRQIRKIREIYEALIDLPRPEQEAYLEEACGKDASLREKVVTLLQESPTFGGELDELADKIYQQQAIAASIERPGTRIDRYRLIEPIGEGGFGVVWLARQLEPVQREVALKVIKVGMDTNEVVARFEAERQALARMEHPNIASVIDAGATETGRPYFVMERVHGIPITQYCDTNNLSNRKRLQLMIDVCHAVQHAHQKGVIHRDLKPSNILVSTQDGYPLPKVIDFGIAKATAGHLTEQTFVTRINTFMGTPIYTSPEQMSMGRDDVDTRTDIYSLGVILYELISGRLPFDPATLNNASMEVMWRLLRETDPPCPSSQLKTLTGSERSSVAKRRQTDSKSLEKLLKGDLDWIVMHCLEKAKSRRYVTANALALDLQHYLNSEPVIARPPTHVYRLKKFVRRNRIMVLAATTVVTTLVLGLTLATWQAIRAMRAEQNMAVAVKNEIAARKSAEGVLLESHAKRLLIEAEFGDNSAGLAHAIACLERGDTPERRRLALGALWKAPLYFRMPPANGTEARNGAAFSPDGKHLFTCSKGSEVLIWPSDGGEPEILPGIDGFDSMVLKLSPSGKFLLVTYQKTGAPPFTGPFQQIVWDAVSHTLVNQWPVSDWGPQWFSRDEKKLLAYSLQDQPPYPGFAWCSINNGDISPLGSPHVEVPTGLRFPPAGIVNFSYVPSENIRRIVSWVGRDIYATEIGENSLGEPAWVGLHDDDIKTVSIDFKGDLISTADERKLTLWDRRFPGQEVARLPSQWTSGVLDRSHRRILTGWPDVNGCVTLYDFRAPLGARGLTFLPLWLAPAAAAIHPGGDWVAITGATKFGSTRWSSLFSLNAVWPFHVDLGFGEETAWNAIRFFPDLKGVAWITGRGRVHTVDLGSEEFPKKVIYESPGRLVIVAIGFDPQMEFIAVGTHRSGAWLVPTGGGDPVPLEASPSMASAIAFNKDGNLIATGGGSVDLPAEERYPRILDRQGRLVARMTADADEPVNELHFLSDSQLLVSTDKALRLWNFRTGEQRLLKEGGHGRIDVSNHYFAAKTTDKVWLYERESLNGRPLAIESTGRYTPVKISPDERFVVSRNVRGTLCVQFIDEDRYHLLPSDDGDISDIWIDPKGYWIAAVNYAGQLSFWPVPRGRPLHDRPLEEFLEILKAQTNVRVHLDPAEERGYRYENLTFPGWQSPPVWQEWYAPAYMANIPWTQRISLD